MKNRSINVNNKSKKINRDNEGGNEDLENDEERNVDADGGGETSNLDKYEVMATGTTGNMADMALSQVNKSFFFI